MEGNRVGVMGDLGLGSTGGDSWSLATLPCAPRTDAVLPSQPWTGDVLIQPLFSPLPTAEGSHAHAAGQRGRQSHQEGN